MFQALIRSLSYQPGRPARRAARTAQTRAAIAFRPAVECLEAREVPAFLAPTTIATSLTSAGIAVGDFNADGKADMAVVNQGGAVSVLVSNGDGTFQPKVDYAAGASAIDATAGDFNGDGKLDLAVVGTGGTVNVLLGRGDGTFAASVAYAVGLGAHSVKVGDFNGDGKLDIGTMNAGTASVLLGNGDGTFQAHLDTPMTGNAINLVVGDFNKDGKLDMATSSTVSIGTIDILRGRGDGTFDPVVSYYANSAPVYLAAGDFNGDGFPDFVVPNSYSATSMSVILNNGDGTYAPPKSYPMLETGYEIEVADFNGDGKQDFAVRGASGFMVSLGKGDGTFYPSTFTAAPGGRFERGTHGDFNGDGAVDFAFPVATGVSVVMNAHDDVANLATAVGFAVTAPATTTSGSSLSLTVSAVDAIGNVVTGFLGTAYVTSNDAASVSGVAYTFTAADAGTHSFAGSVRLVTGGTQSVTVATPFLTPTTVAVNVTGQVGHYAVSAPTATTAGNTFNVTVSAIDTAGNVAPTYTSSVSFSSSDVQAGLPASYTFTAADAGVHTFAVTLKTAGSQSVAVAEVGGTVRGNAAVAVASAAVKTLSLASTSGAIGVSRAVTVAGRDAYGNIATSYTGTVHFTSSDPLAQLPPDATLINGTVTVAVKYLTVGTQTLTATDVATATLVGTMSSTATPPVASLFVVTGFPATVAGVAHTFTVTVRDTIGQVAAGYTGTVTFSSSDRQAGLPAFYTFTAADAGVHTFTGTLKTAGAQSIVVRDFTTLVGSQSGISVTAAALTGLRLSVPNGTDSKGHYLVAAGDAISLTVRAVDAFGNTILGYKGKVKFSSTDIKAGLPTDYTFTTADAGVHTFTVVLKTATPNAVSWSFGVVDASNAATLATLANFDVINGAAASFVLTVPSNIAVGTPFTVKVEVLDAYGNTVKNYFGTVHFSNSAGLPADYTFSRLDAGVHSFAVTLSTLGLQSISITDLAMPSLTSTVTVSVLAAGGGGGGGGGSGGGKGS